MILLIISSFKKFFIIMYNSTLEVTEDLLKMFLDNISERNT